jgi:hypothetical protein
MKLKTKQKLNCLLSLEDIDLLKENNHNPYEFMILEKNAEVKVFQVIDQSQKPISLRY